MNDAIYQFTYRSGQKLSWVKRVGTPQPVLIPTVNCQLGRLGDGQRQARGCSQSR